MLKDYLVALYYPKALCGMPFAARILLCAGSEVGGDMESLYLLAVAGEHDERKMQ
jgi:hypothetical protein